MSKYCCFFHPEKDYSEKELTDLCPHCQRPYGFVLDHMPTEINNGGKSYSVIKAVGRGFYGATYLCEIQKRFKKEQVLLKVMPVNLYNFFGKDFYEECNKHAEVSEKTEHLVKIEDAFDADICYEKEILKCHVAELQYIQGVNLSEYIGDSNHINPKIFAQIAIDLLKLWNELMRKGEFHNDLHLGNLMVEQLDGSLQRVDAIYDRIRLVAIDLNSVTDRSLSNSEGSRLGDRKYIANHISMLSTLLRDRYENIDDISDTDFRLIETLNKISRILSVPAPLTDIPEISELVDMIKEEFKSNISYAPWKRTFVLSKLNDGINAQTLPTCYVPQLLVDPENKWIDEISVSGPQLITGMRGCGKTMLLAALDVHARLTAFDVVAEQVDTEFSLFQDRFVGIMASCKELVGIKDIEEQGIPKLVLLYSVQIIRAIRHIKDIEPLSVKKDYHLNIAKNLEDILGISFDEKMLYSDTVFERYISDISNHMDDLESSLRVSCITAFEKLAEALISAADILNDKQVYFLLDDASTRYISVEDISSLLTKVLFMSSKCAFKITTELQTLYSFKSPGNIEMAQDIRDYQIFDLGADVYRRTHDSKLGKRFIESIIVKRLKACNELSPTLQSLENSLGDCTLTELANYIIENTSSKSRKTVYYGATALTALCVGDIGDIIFLYDSIITSNESGLYPVDRKIQTQCFQQLCSRRMYNLERKDSALREYVKAFSEASYKCLMDSKKAVTRQGSRSTRIRQYNSLYIRMTSGNIERQQENLRRLIDSGIFVYADGNGWPRSKSNDTDPITQTKLAFRKLFGVSNFIGLGNADRFELSGEVLEQWLEKPSKELLLRNLGKYDDASEVEKTDINIKEKAMEVEEQLEEIVGHSYQMSLFDNVKESESDADKLQFRNAVSNALINRAQIKLESEKTRGRHFDVGIFGLGFEERCLESVNRILNDSSFNKIILIRYDELGFAEEIRSVISGVNEVKEIYYTDIKDIVYELDEVSSLLIDTTGLYKPIIFEVVRQSVILNIKLSVVHTMAQYYYPLNTDIQPLIETKEVDDATRFADLMRGLITGDEGEYSHVKLFNNKNYDPIRPTALVGFVSPKNQRIFSMLDKTEYESVNLLIPSGKTARDILSQTAGNIAITNYSAVRLKKIDAENPEEVLQEMCRCYAELYIDKNFNFEISLTGSKMQTVAAAVFSSVCKVSQCWYIKPSKFDTKHFTKGVGDTYWYRIKMNNKESMEESI